MSKCWPQRAAGVLIAAPYVYADRSDGPCEVKLEVQLTIQYSHYLKGGGNDLCLQIQRKKRCAAPL